jgi:hypothetical protein
LRLGVPSWPYFVRFRGFDVTLAPPTQQLYSHRRIVATATAAKSNRSGATSAILPALL